MGNICGVPVQIPSRVSVGRRVLAARVTAQGCCCITPAPIRGPTEACRLLEINFLRTGKEKSSKFHRVRKKGTLQLRNCNQLRALLQKHSWAVEF